VNFLCGVLMEVHGAVTHSLTGGGLPFLCDDIGPLTALTAVGSRGKGRLTTEEPSGLLHAADWKTALA
jgi:hypothetical protein